MRPERACPQCGGVVAAGGKRRFCSDACKRNYHNLDLSRSVALMPLLQVFRYAESRYKNGAPKAVSAFAFKEACALIDRYNAEDRANGRNALPLVLEKFEKGWRAGDLEARKPLPKELPFGVKPKA